MKTEDQIFLWVSVAILLAIIVRGVRASTIILYIIILANVCFVGVPAWFLLTSGGYRYVGCWVFLALWTGWIVLCNLDGYYKARAYMPALDQIK